jgi:hypothetical protein
MEKKIQNQYYWFYAKLQKFEVGKYEDGTPVFRRLCKNIKTKKNGL